MTDLGTATVTVIRPGAPDWQGDPSAGTQFPVDGCAIEPGPSQETVTNGDTVVSDYILRAPAGADIVATDRVQLPDGTICAVTGRPARWAGEDGTEDHVQVQLTALDGV